MDLFAEDYFGLRTMTWKRITEPVDINIDPGKIGRGATKGFM